MTRRRRKRESLAPRTQREVIRDVMLSAGQCATWLTLDELAKLTQFPPASISAQLRHLRKRMRGAFEVVKRCRVVNPAMRGEGLGVLWEYAVRPVARGTAARPRHRRRVRAKSINAGTRRSSSGRR